MDFPLCRIFEWVQKRMFSIYLPQLLSWFKGMHIYIQFFREISVEACQERNAKRGFRFFPLEILNHPTQTFYESRRMYFIYVFTILYKTFAFLESFKMYLILKSVWF